MSTAITKPRMTIVSGIAIMITACAPSSGFSASAAEIDAPMRDCAHAVHKAVSAITPAAATAAQM